MKIVNILGGLGNQMFQYALAVALRERYKDEEIFIDITNFKGYGLHNGFELDKIFNLSIPKAGFRQILKVGYPYCHYQLWRIGHRLLPRRKSMVYGFQDEELPSDLLYESDKYFDGYWQSDEFFRKYRDTVLQEYSFPEITEKENIDLLGYLKDNTVSIHIRRGDYVNHPIFKDICTVEYYKKALDYVVRKTSVDNIIVFSNDIEWCKSTFKEDFKNIPHVYVNWNKGDKSFRDMQLMSLCKHNIIANSSFSWWGAWLNNNTDKIVIAPSKWNNREVNQDRFIPKEWVKI